MANLVQTAHSKNGNSAQAATELLAAFNANSTNLPPKFCLIFAGDNHDLETILKAMANGFSGANEVEVLGCSTNGEFTEKAVSDGGVAAFAVYSDNMTVNSQVETGMDYPEVLAESLAEEYQDQQQAAKKLRQLHGTALLLTDGLKPTAEQIVRELSRNTSAFLQLVGGAAADDGSMTNVQLGTQYQVGNDQVAALQIFTPSRIGLGLGHGLVPACEPMTVTAADRNRIIEIDGKKASEIYKTRLIERGVEFKGHGAIPYFPGNELGLYFLKRVNRARAVLRMEKDGSLVCAGEVPTQSKICFLDSDAENLIEAAQSAAREARINLGGKKAVGAVLFDCACRKGILKQEFKREVQAVSEELGGVPVAGFMTYGEIARYAKQLVGWHNTTAVVMAIPEN